MPFDKEIEIEVVKRTGHCSVDHKEGDKFRIKSYKTPAGICLSAFHAIWPPARTLLLDGEHPWEEQKDETTVACPDPDNPVVFRLRRVKKG
jgi:uncharacterized repeat protein (TIGR04076 family)